MAIGDVPSWSLAATQLQREIAADLLTHTVNSVFEDEGAGGPRGAPAIKAALRKSAAIILTGHGAGALVAYETTLSLLRHYPDALKAHVKCITFGMPAMGWQGRQERDSFLRLIAPTLTSVPLLRRDLPCPHFLHIVRQEDVVPSSSLCSRKVRSSVAAALSISAERLSGAEARSPSHSPYDKLFTHALLDLDDDSIAASGAAAAAASIAVERDGVSCAAEYDSDDSDGDAPPSRDGPCVPPGSFDAAHSAAEGDANSDQARRSVWGWKAWKNKGLIGINGSSVQWHEVSKAVRLEASDVCLPEWWPLGRFWFFCDSEPFDTVRTHEAITQRRDVEVTTPTGSWQGNDSAIQRRDRESPIRSIASYEASSSSSEAGQGSLSPSKRRDGTVVRVRRWVVQFPYFMQATSSGTRELFDPFPDSVGLLRDMLATGVHALHLRSTHRHQQQGAKERRSTSASEIRSEHWPVQHHLGQYMNALHSWVGSSEWQISRRREMASSISSRSVETSEGNGADAKRKGNSSNGTHQPQNRHSVAPLSPIPESLDAKARNSWPSLASALVPSTDTVACQPRVDTAVCSCVSDGVKTLLQVSVRGLNLHFVDVLQVHLFAWSNALGVRSVESLQPHAGTVTYSSNSLSRPDLNSTAGAFGRGRDAGGADGEDGMSIRIKLRICTNSRSATHLLASCDAPYGWIGAGAELRLMGSCIREERVACDISRITSCRSLHPAVSAVENAPVCALLEQVLLLQDLLRNTSGHALRSRGLATCMAQARNEQCCPQFRHAQLGDTTGQGAFLPRSELWSSSGVALVEELMSELMNLEDKTRSQWNDFMRTLSLGGTDPHAHISASSPSSSRIWPVSTLLTNPLPEGADGAGQNDENVDTILEETRDISDAAELIQGRSSIKEHVRAAMRASERRRECLEQIEDLIKRPLSLSMDRSPRFKQMMGLTLAITAGATIMAGSCLLAPSAAASLMPSMAAYVTPAYAVSGMFATSIVGTHMQARCTIDGSYVEKLLHFAAALRIYTPSIFPRAMYLEAAIATRVVKHARSVLSLAPICSLEQLLANPALFVSQLAQPDSWRRLIDSQHYFEFLDFKDKKFVLDFLWVIVSIHRFRVQLASKVSIAVAAPRVSSPIPRALLRRLFPTMHPSQSVSAPSSANDESAFKPESAWQVMSYELTEDQGLMRLDVINVPDEYLSSAQTPASARATAHPAASRPDSTDSSGIKRVSSPVSGEGHADRAGSGTESRTNKGGTKSESTSNRGRAELVRSMAAAQLLVLAWHEASYPGSILMIGRLLARRSASAKAPMPRSFGAHDESSDASTSLRRTREGESEHVLGFKVLLTGVPRGDTGAISWLTDKINRKLDVSRWRSFIAVARRRIRMQRPQTVDVAFLNTVAQDALLELDLPAAEVPQTADLKLLLASRALDDDWLTRPALLLDESDLIPLHYAQDQAQQGGIRRNRNLGTDTVTLPDVEASTLESDRSPAMPHGSTSDVAPGFSVLRDLELHNTRPTKTDDSCDHSDKVSADEGAEHEHHDSGDETVAAVDELDHAVVEHLRGWLLTRLQAIYLPGGCNGVAAHEMSASPTSPWNQVCCAFRPHLCQNKVTFLQACVRRSLQRTMLVCEHFDAQESIWRYSRCESDCLPGHGYWPTTTTLPPQLAPVTKCEHLPNYGHKSCERIISLEKLVQARANFCRSMQSILQVYWFHIARLHMLDRYFDELSAVVSKLPPMRSDRRHPMTVLQQLFGLASDQNGLSHDEAVALLPKDLLRNDTDEGSGVSYWLFQLLGAAPLPGDKLRSCYEVRLGPLFVSMAQDLCRLPLYSNDSLTALIDELVASGASCSPPVSRVLASLATQGARLDEVLYAPVPPALHLRVTLSILMHACPPTHPDAQHLRSAMLHIDSSFAIASVVQPDAVNVLLQCPSILGRVGPFFARVESRFDKLKRSTISRGPVVMAHLEMLGEAVDDIQSFRSKLSRELVEFSGLESGPAGHVWSEMADFGIQDDGWEFVSPIHNADVASHMVVVERAVNSVLLTRLWPTLDDLLSGVEREKDARIALGLPAFGWDDKGLSKLLHHLGIPAGLVAPLRSASRVGSSEDKHSDAMSGDEIASALPVFYTAAAESLRDMSSAKTPEEKAQALAAAARAILLCLQQFFSQSSAQHVKTCDGSDGQSREVRGGVDATTLLQRCLAFTVLRMAHENGSSTFRRDAHYVRCLHVPALNAGMLGMRQKKAGSHFSDLDSWRMCDDGLKASSLNQGVQDVAALLQADVGLLMSEFEEALEWIDSQVTQMLRPERGSGSGQNVDDDGSLVEYAGGASAYGALVEAAGVADWAEVLRLLEQPQHEFTLRAWQRVELQPDGVDASIDSGTDSVPWSALHAAAAGGHEALLLYLMHKTANGISLDVLPGDQVFCSSVYTAVKLMPAGPGRIGADYAFRSLVMLRSQRSYAQRLQQLRDAVGAKQAWMDEDEDGLYSACFGDLDLNAELASAVARELDQWIVSCISQRTGLRGLTASHALVNAIIFAIKSVQHQFDRVDKEARPRLSKPSSLTARWRGFIQEVERVMGQREGLGGQRLSDLLCWPLQRSMRYKDLVLDLMQAAANCAEGHQEGTPAVSVTPRKLLQAISQEANCPATASRNPAAGGSEAMSGRALAIRMARSVQESVDTDMGTETVGVLQALLRVKDETELLNLKVAQASMRHECAEKAWFYLDGMLGAEQVLSDHCEFVAHSVATCRLPEGPGSWSHGKTLKLLLLRGSRRQLLFYSEALGVGGKTRSCVLKVDMSSVISISEPQSEGAQQDQPAPGNDAQHQTAGLTETFTMTLKLGSNSSDQSSSIGEDAGHGGKLVTSVLMLTSVAGASTMWSRGLQQLSAGLLLPAGCGELQRLRYLVQSARVLMREEQTKRQSVQRHRNSYRE